ncbi:MAG: hypothetical protein J6X37_02990 [Treponema sp.]|nr:hypothetical protein [Treponema sp.]
MKGFDLYVEQLSRDLNTYELKMFRVQHDEMQLSTYLKKYAKKHQSENINKVYLVRYGATGQLVAWFGLKTATLPYNDEGDSFLIPAVELTHFAVDERFRNPIGCEQSVRTGEFIYWNFILPIVKDVAEKVACKALFVFAIDTPKLVSYYKKVLKFKELPDTNEKQFFEYAEPDYDEGCKFLYFPIE